MQLVLAADVAVLRQAQHRLDVDALDGWLLAGIYDEDLDRVLLLEHQVSDHGSQHRPALGQNAYLDGGRFAASHRDAESENKSSSLGRTARRACSDSCLTRTLVRM